VLSPERWQVAERIFHEAVSVPADQRAALVEAGCGGDDELRKEVLSLLEAESQAGGMDESLAAQIAADWAGASSPPVVGRDIEGYHVKALLGAGGMGETYLAEDAALGRRVALKLLPAAFGKDARRVRRFIEEARAASALNHPGIVTVYSAGVFEGQRYIATEFIDGETVRQRLAKGPIPAAAALDIAIQTAAALEAAHGAGIIHRDIKPENIMIRRDGFVKIIDFGIAKPIEPAGVRPRSVTLDGDVVGTIDYMAPEQAAGAAVDVRADLYSLTVVLYEMLTGELPRELGSGSGSEGAQKRSGVISASVLRLVRRGVARDPAKRYQTACEFQRDLEGLREVAARPYQQARRLGAAALAVLALAFGIYRSTSTSHSASGVTSLVVMPLKALGGSDQEHLEQGMTEAIIARLSGLRQLRVPPAEAIRANEDAFDAARRLGVDAVLTGSVQREGDRLRVTAQLSRASDRAQIWAEHYDETFTGIFGIQDAIAERVATSLVAEISPRDRAMLTRHETRNSEAYDLYLRAREQWALRTPNTIRTAIKMYRQAIAIEPNFALAYAGLADSYNLAVSGMAPLTRAPLAKAAAERAIALDPQSAEAHTAMAFQEYKFEWKWEDADREFRQAIDLNPHYALAHHWYGEFLKLLMRHDESVREFRQAVEADPFSIPIRYDFILSLINAGRIAEARTVLNESMAIDPAALRVLIAESEVLKAEGRTGEWIEPWLRSQLFSGASETEVNAFRNAYRAGGERALNRKRLEFLLGQVKPGNYMAPFSATNLADLYARLGDRERTLLWLKKATDLHEDEPLMMMTHLFDFLRQDQEFIAIEKRVGFVR
jgi:serine/threonine-protein kinase